MFLARRKFWFGVLKTVALAYAAFLILLQAPELGYDFGPRTPVRIEDPAQLEPQRFAHATFASVAGTPDLDRAFVYGRHGVFFTYFLLEEYGPRLVIRSYEPVTEESQQINRFVGRLRPFERQPFDHRVRQTFAAEFDIEIPPGALVLSMDDVPQASAWQVGGVGFVGVLWAVMFYFFVVRPIRKRAERRPS